LEGKTVKLLFLSEEEMIKAGVLDMPTCLETMEKVFTLVGKGDYLMGGKSLNSHGIKIHFPKESPFPGMPVAGPDRRFMAMVAYLGGEFHVCGEKWYGSNIINPTRGLPRSVLVVVLNDPDTCAPFAFMSANLISAMRTGAMPGLGAKFLARKDAKSIGIIGAGVISRGSLLSLVEACKTATDVKVYDLFPEKSAAFCAEMSALTGRNVHPVASLEEAVVGSDVVNMAAAGANPPHIKGEWLKPGSLLSLPAGGVLDEGFLAGGADKVVIDCWEMHKAFFEEGEVPVDAPTALTSRYLFKHLEKGEMTEDQITSLGDVVVGKKPGRTSDSERIVYIQGGMPVEDLAWGLTVYKKAVEMGIGTELKLWDSAHWM
jgi:ornithine cyclodeaminase/alanine dehydrogenase-like protein (mu-crystallin family)